MEFIKSQEKFSMYTKSNCLYCDLSKLLFQNSGVEVLLINCDNYLLDNRDNFLLFIKQLCGKEYKTFPIIFYNGLFIGGYIEIKELLINDF